MVTPLKQVAIWSDRGPYDNCTTPRTNLHHKRGLELILGLVQSQQWQQYFSGRTNILQFHHPSGIDYRASNRFMVNLFEYIFGSKKPIYNDLPCSNITT